jgi:hypothetical protein
MTGQTHALVGAVVLVTNLLVGAWAVVDARAGRRADRLLIGGAAVALGLLALQALLGLDLWLRGFRPAGAPLAELHVLGPAVALVVGLFLLLTRRRERPRSLALAALLTVVVGLVSYSIGEMG